MPRQHWTESSNPDRVAANVGARVAIWIIAAIVLVGLIGGGIWAFKVATSDLKGAGDATRITNDGRSRVNAQEWFQAQYGQIKTADTNLDAAYNNLQAATTVADKEFWRTNFTSLKNRCVDMVNAYNAEAGKVSRGKWRDTTLPFQIDQSDPATDCKASTETETTPR